LIEIGAGMHFTMLDGALVINPQLGISCGNYQSGGGRAVLGDNVVPALGVYYTKGNFTANANFTVWKHAREESDNQSYIDLMEYSTNPTLTISKVVSLGLYYDHMFNRKIASKDGDGVRQGDSRTRTSYLWIGPSLKLTVKSGSTLWFSAGVDLSNSVNNLDDKKIKDFYKMILSFSI
jgi:hypothetical protein